MMIKLRIKTVVKVIVRFAICRLSGVLIASHIELLLVKGPLWMHSEEASVLLITKSSSVMLLKLMSLDDRLEMLF